MFGFILFCVYIKTLSDTVLSFSSAMGEGNGIIDHDIHGTLIQMNGSHSGSSGRSTPNNTNDPAPGKLFVGGLSWQTSSEKLKEYFGMFGNVTDVLIMKDPVTQVRFIHFYGNFEYLLSEK